MVGLFVGVVPVALGMMFYPVMLGAGRRALEFVLALTIGLLVFLLVDTLEEGLEVAAGAASGLQATAVVWLAALVTFVALMVIGRRGGRAPAGVALAAFIALGIGLHNLGEGLVIGAAFATGEAALASFLVVGFALHNVTEGVGIAAPLVEARPRLGLRRAGRARRPAGGARHLGRRVRLLAALGGAVLRHRRGRHPPGGGRGRGLSAPARRAGRRQRLSGTTLAGFAGGLVVMYATAILVAL